MKKKLVSAMVAFGIVALPGMAHSITVANYLDHLRSQKAGDVQTGRALEAYVLGLVEGVWSTNATGTKRVFCPPDKISNTSFAMYNEWIKEGIRNNITLPDLESRELSGILIATLKGKFPCE
ncbi:MAG: hypothetical protein ACFHHU_00570 [Porticoccaceae bacterium]